MMVNSRTLLTYELDEAQFWDTTDEKGLPLRVHNIVIALTGGETLTKDGFMVTGKALRSDGTEGTFARFKHVTITDIPEPIRSVLVSTVNATRMAHGEVQD